MKTRELTGPLTSCQVMTQTQCDKTTQHLEAQHEELLRKIDELDKRVSEVLAEWIQVADQDLIAGEVK